jgi:hypothetical protein
MAEIEKAEGETVIALVVGREIQSGESHQVYGKDGNKLNGNANAGADEIEAAICRPSGSLYSSRSRENKKNQ